MTADFYSLFNKKNEPSRDLGNVTPIDPERATRYAQKALRSEVENVAAAQEGRRNHTLNKAAFNIAQLVAAGHIEHQAAWDALGFAARSTGLSNPEINGTLKSAFGAGVEQPRVVAEQPAAPDPHVLTDPDGEPLLNPILDWHDLWNKEDDEEWIVPPILPARRMVAIYSEPKAGKSLLVLEIAVAVARGTEIFGRVPDRPRRVLYIDFENDPLQDVRTRLEAMGHGPHDLDNLKYLSFPQLAKMDNATGGDDLIRHVLGYDCEVVIIDTLSRAVAGDENENDTWLNFYRHSGLALKREGIACIRLDHSGKDRSKGMRGGSAKASDVDAVWNLTLVNDDTVHLDCTHNRMRVETKKLVLRRDDEPLLKHVPLTDPLAGLDAKVRGLIDTLDGLGVPNSASNRDCRAALKAAGKRADNGVLTPAVKQRQLVLDGLPSVPERFQNTPDIPEQVFRNAPP